MVILTCDLQPLQTRWYPHFLSYDKLPGFLHPRPGYPQQPPVYHCGWPVDRNWIVEYARAHNLVVPNDPPSPLCAEGDSDSDSDASAEAPGEEGVAVGLTTGRVCEKLPGLAGVPPRSTLRLTWEVIFGDNMDSSRICIAVCSNYHEAYRRSIMAPDIRKVRDHLGKTEHPRWYLDFLDAEWDDRMPS